MDQPDDDATPDAIPRPARRVSRWDRPKHPRDWRFWVGGAGRVLMAIGLLMFGFVAYQLWGTGIEYRQHQNSLENAFEQRVAELATSTTASSPAPSTAAPNTAAPPTTGPAISAGPSTSAVGASTTSSTTVATAASPWPDIELGDVIAYIEIPKIGSTVYAVAGIRTQDLKQGLGHYPDTPLPGQLGNSAFAGHRTTYGAPLYNIDELVAGDEIIVNTLTGVKYVYRMVGESRIVAPSAYGVIRDSDPLKATLTITSCHPRYSAKQRIVIRAELDTSVSTPSGKATPFYVDPDEVSPGSTDDEPDDSSVVTDDEATDGSGGIVERVDTGQYEGAEGLSRGWFSDSGAWPQVALWAVIITLILVGSYLLDRRLKRYWPGIVLAIVPFVVTLYFLYQNINRLLPPDL